MTQDQYGQARDSGYVSGQVVEDDDTGEYADDQGKPMTRFQKVASALRGDRSDSDPQTSQDSQDSQEPQDPLDPRDQAEDTVPDAMGQDTYPPVAPDPNGAAPDQAAAVGSGGKEKTKKKKKVTEKI